MYPLRTSLSLIVSGVVHTGIIVVLASRTTATYLPVNTFAPVEVLPPPAPSKPPPPAEEPKPRERTPEPNIRSPQPTVSRTKSEPQPQPQAPQEPVALAGFALSNTGLALVRGNGSGFGPQFATVSPKAPPTVSPTTPNPTPLTSLSDLSRKPSPPALDGALARHYPPHLRSSGVEGQAMVRVIVGRAGEVRTTTLLSESHPGFGNACQKALQQSRWGAPIDQAGNPTSTSLQYRCRFTVGL